MSEVVKIFDISYNGSGVGKLADGKIVFVPKSLPGEKVLVDVESSGTKFCIGKCAKVLTPSNKREAAKCPYFNICGGCDFQNINQKYEQEIKTQILKRELAKADYNSDIKFVESPERYFYRNKLKLEVQDCQLGYFAAKTHNFFSINTCPIADKNILETFPVIETFLRENNFQNIKNVYIKKLEHKIGICFLFEKNIKIDKKNVKNMQILRNFDVFFAFGDILESDKTKVVAVSGGGGLKVDCIQAFNQVNDYVAKLLYNDIIKYAKNKTIINAYSGQGLLTLLLSTIAKFVAGIEFQKSAHHSAEKLCQEKKNIKNFCGRVEDVLPEIIKRQHFDMIVLDPAREGCKKAVLDAVCQSCIDKIVYVSCNFASLVRDLKILTANYYLESVKIFDMFPCTANMEVFVILTKKQ